MSDSETSSEEMDYSSGEGSGSESGSGNTSGSLSETERSALVPYSFEPSDTDSENNSDSESSNDEERMLDLSWCLCTKCSIMATNRECVCCREIVKLVAKVQGLGDATVTCITQHPGFQTVCLDVWVLQTAYFQYRQEHGVPAAMPSLHEKYRYTAYRQLTRWCWGWLGKDLRVVLPACAVTKIRETFPSEAYTGFHYPTLHE